MPRPRRLDTGSGVRHGGIHVEHPVTGNAVRETRTTGHTRGEGFPEPHLLRRVRTGGAGQFLHQRHRAAVPAHLRQPGMPGIPGGAGRDDPGCRDPQRLPTPHQDGGVGDHADHTRIRQPSGHRSRYLRRVDVVPERTAERVDTLQQVEEKMT